MSSSLSQRTCLVISWLSRVLSRTFPLVVRVVSCVPPSCHCPCTILSDSAVIWGCISTYYCLVIMRVGVRFHGILYPMTDCVLYLGRTVVWVV